MSNQNNTMQKLEMQSNVNLSRYKNNIDGALKVNDTNMPVLGNKFNPMKKEVTVNKEFVFESKDKTIFYDKFDDNVSAYIVTTTVAQSKLDKINKIDKDIIGISTKENHVYYYKYDANTSLYSIASYDYINDIEHIVVSNLLYNEGFFVYPLGTGFELVVIPNYRFFTVNTTDWSYRGFLANDEKLIDFSICKVPELSSYTSASSYTLNGNYKKGVLIKRDATESQLVIINDNGTFGQNTFVNNSTFFSNITDNSLFWFFDSSAITTYGVSTSNAIYRINISNDILGSKIYQLLSNKAMDRVDIYNVVSNGFIRDVSLILKSSDKKLAISFKGCSYADYANAHNLYAMNMFTSIENQKPVDNFLEPIFDANYTCVGWCQGANIISIYGLGIDTIDQNYCSKETFDLFIPNYLKLKNGKWVYKNIISKSEYVLNPNGYILETPNIVNNKIYNNDVVIENGIYKMNGVIPSYHLSDNDFIKMINTLKIQNQNSEYPPSLETFSSFDDWTSKARYWAFGNSNAINDDNFITIQVAPFAVGLDKTSFTSDGKYFDYFFGNKYIYVQESNDDATLYNFLGEAYVAPTDGDFYIPLMPTDKIIGSVLDKTIIERPDGSKAELIKFNNKYLPAYQYSTITKNVEYSFVVQGQIYNVANDVICNDSGVGTCDVSDQEFIGCNGVFALFYNERCKTIYQFGASNVLEPIFDCDNIKSIIQADVSNTNDEIYILYKDYDNIYRLICIETDGQIYVIDTGDSINKFQIGNKGIYIWRNNNCYLISIFTPSDETTTQNCYLETNYYGTDEFKLMNVDRIYLRFVPTVADGTVNDITVNLSMLTLDGEVNEQYVVNPSTEIHRIAPRQKQCLGIKVRLDNLVNYTLSAMSIGITDDSNVVTDNKVINNNLDASLFD